MAQGQTSSTYIGDRKSDDVPHFVSAVLLDLHYVCLVQARTLGLVRGSSAILSNMGGRIPVGVMMKMAEAAGYDGRVLVLSWKEQSEPEAVIGGYADHQQNGLGPVSPPTPLGIYSKTGDSALICGGSSTSIR